MKKFKLTSIIFVFLFLISGCTLKESYLIEKPCDIGGHYEYIEKNSFLNQNIYKPHSLKIQKFLDTHKNVRTLYFENIEGVEKGATTLIARNSRLISKYHIQMECSLQDKIFIKYDANVKSKLTLSKGFALLESIILIDNKEYTVKTDVEHNYVKL